jgi:hypothetical protein
MDTPIVHINRLYADAVFQEIRKKRFGLKVCKAHVDIDLADDLRNIYARQLELVDCGCNPDLSSCSKVKVEERINTL